MKPQVNILALVDVIGALSDRTLGNGNLSLVDNGDFHSLGQGTPELCTIVSPGQVVQWQVLAVDLQTPVEIKSITFLGPEGANGGALNGGSHNGAPDGGDGEKLDLGVWIGIVPPYLPPGVGHRYRLELQMYEGDNSVMHIDSPTLMCL
ncbi:hypothetical protein [Yinghuangia seranimata]|uniref:hypothetical protein n=1 Tax=Yinghuangia seranimata TaxID=408067 RepID=UPI00248D268C|nr:hypothetical protein [Yinghuangia seranimata]MDI2126451.1 hypothetical protein [Yinghuangia seranimata]